MGARYQAPVVSVAVPPSMAAALLRADFPDVASELARIGMAAVETVGVVVRRERVRSRRWPSWSRSTTSSGRR